LRGAVEALADSAPQYLRPALDDIGAGAEDWHDAWTVDLAARNFALPCGRVDAAFVERELNATAPATLNLLEPLLKQVAYRREQGRCRVLTQIYYVAERRSDLEKV
jgi:hypothetical protein